MAELRTEETKTVNRGVDEDGTVVEQRTDAVATKADGKTTIVNVIWYIYGFVAILLAIRMIMKLFGANSGNAFVDLVYSISGVLSLPFDTMFGVATADAGNTQAVFEPSILVAIAVYGLVAWGIAKLLTVNER